MLRESITPNHILVLPKVSPQNFLSLNPAEFSASNCIQKQSRIVCAHFLGPFSCVATPKPIKRNPAKGNDLIVITIKVREYTSALQRKTKTTKAAVEYGKSFDGNAHSYWLSRLRDSL